MNIAVETENQIQEPVQEKTLYEKLSTSVVWAKIFRWEFWPFSVFYFPIMFYWAWLSLKTRSFFFFTAANPTIEFGGMLGESKHKIFNLIPGQFIPKTYKLNPSVDQESFLERLKLEGLDYPFIVKPDIGERGWMVEIIKTEKELAAYLNRVQVDFLVQEYVPYEVELGIFYYRYPNCDHGTVSSIVMKDMLSVTGDGERNIESLMYDDARAKMHIEDFRIKKPELLERIPAFGEKVEINSIGNHSRGTTFLNGNHLINERLIKVIEKVSSQIDGFYFGRYDLRCRSVEDLYQGNHFKILELNGAGAEPAHIYQPGFSLIQAYKDIIHHLKVLADISMLNKKKGIPYYSFRQGLKEIKKIKKYNQQKN
ncbi:MAG: hypothetical protein R8N23_03885 [Reichenbachiella sp.]|uniref:hypothetical protein n=1 Tax=Reichenbachiella sp. TaxID=2184521 RepID=UPI0029663272|nr:hypothetical protein [Reichenbachiella sp.]MDW3208979.1 hypothetical protein [Reichenbachiella sp.]